jgi:AcrR family transcriptional regulator
LFTRYGVRSVTMNEIASALGVSKKTIYQYYADKNEIVMAVMQYHMEMERQDVEKIKQQAVNAVDEMLRIREYVYRMMREFHPAIMFEVRKYYPDALQEFERFKEDFIVNLLEKNLERGIQEGSYRPQLATSIAARGFVEIANLAIDPDVFSQQAYQPAQVQHELTDVFIQGMCTDQGKERIQAFYQTAQQHEQNRADH